MTLGFVQWIPDDNTLEKGKKKRKKKERSRWQSTQTRTLGHGGFIRSPAQAGSHAIQSLGRFKSRHLHLQKLSWGGSLKGALQMGTIKKGLCGLEPWTLSWLYDNVHVYIAFRRCCYHMIGTYVHSIIPIYVGPGDGDLWMRLCFLGRLC